METNISKVKKWLEKPGNTKVKLAAFLGYDSSAAINQWLKRKSIPKHQEVRVIKFIEGDK